MLIASRLRKLEEQIMVRQDHLERVRVRDAVRAALENPAASQALEEIAEASAEYGNDDPRTQAIIHRVSPILDDADRQYRGTHGR